MPFRSKSGERLGLDFLFRVPVAIALFTELANALLYIDLGQLRTRKGVQGLQQVRRRNPDVRCPLGKLFAVLPPLGPQPSIGHDPQDLLSKLGNPRAVYIAKRWVRVFPKQGADLRRTFVISHGLRSPATPITPLLPAAQA